MRLSRPLFTRTLAAASLAAALSCTTLPAFAHNGEDHSANPVAAEQARQQAADHTQALVALQKRWEKAQGAEKSRVRDQMIAKAEERRAFLLELMESNPAEVLRVAIPEEKQAGMPAEVVDKLEQKLELEGELELLHVDNFEDPSQSRFEKTLKTAFGERFKLHAPHQFAAFQSGQKVRINGVFIDAEDGSDGNIAIGQNEDDILLLAAENGPTYGTTPGVLPRTFGEQRVLVMMVNFQDDSSQPWTRSAVQSNMTNVDNFFQEASYGQTWLKSDVTNWLSLPISGSGCNYSEISSRARDAAVKAGYDVGSYDRLVYAWPAVSSCGWGGLGSVGGNPSGAWFNGGSILQAATTSHELGHNLGLYHSHDLACSGVTLGTSCSIKEYGDKADTMGAGQGHFNVYQKDRLGWLGSSILTITSSGTYQLAPHEFSSNKPLALKVLKGFNSKYNSNDWYYLEYRQPKGFDSILGNSFYDAYNWTSGISIHTGNQMMGDTSYLLDMNPSTSGFHDAALNVGQSYSDSNAGVSFTTEWSDTNGAEVYVSVAGSPNSCVKAKPSVSFTPAEGPWVATGTAVSYQVTVKNNDSSDCSSSSFGVSATKPSGWTTGFVSGSLNLAPGASASTTLTVTSSSTATDGFYNIGVTAASGSYSASGTVTYVVDNPTVTNTAPVAKNDSASTNANTAVTIYVLANDSDPDGDALNVSSVSGVNGTAKINSNGTITFTPASGFSGTEAFNYSISDGKGGSASATVSVSVSAVSSNKAPVAVDDSASTEANNSVTIAVLGNDYDPDGDTLKVTSITQGAKGSVKLNSDGTLTFTPAKNFKNSDSFGYTISDGKSSASATVNVSLTASSGTGGPGNGNGKGPNK